MSRVMDRMLIWIWRLGTSKYAQKLLTFYIPARYRVIGRVAFTPQQLLLDHPGWA